MKLIVISSSTTLENEAEIVTQLFEAGLETFHLRKLKISTKRMRAFIRQIPEHFHDRIFLHSHHNLAFKFNLGGIHLTSSHKKRKFRTWLKVFLIKLRHPKIEMTTSFRTIGHLLDLEDNHAYSYVFLSPVFSSSSSRFQSGFTEHSLHSVIAKTRFNVIARGGVDVSVIEKGDSLGFKGLAFYSSIWKAKDPLIEFNKVVKEFERLNIPIE